MKVIIFLLISLALCVSSKLDTNWWQHTNIYEIFIWSYKDSDGDGIGDFAGLKSKLDHLEDLGIEVIKLTPIFSSPDPISESYGIDNFTDVHSTLGILDDFDELMSEARSRGIKVILDINFNHCYKTHEWFENSVEGIEPYKNYFIWKDPTWNGNGDREPPNSQKTFSSLVSVWNWEERRKQYYYSICNSYTPNLNLGNADLKKELNKIMKFWLDKGVSGFDIKGQRLYKNDQTVVTEGSINEDFYDFISQLRGNIDIYNEENVEYERILTTDGDSNMKIVGNKNFPLAHFTPNTILQRRYTNLLQANVVKNMIKPSSDSLEDGIIHEWVVYGININRPFDNSDFYCDIIQTIAAVLPGIWHLSYGSELGMKQNKPKWNMYNANKLRFKNTYALTMQWDSSKNAGFSDSDQPILFPNPDYWKVNAEKQMNEKISVYNYFKDLLKLRKEKAFKYGNLRYLVLSEWILAILRNYERSETFITLFNLTTLTQSVDLKAALNFIQDLPPQLEVVTSTPNSLYQKGDKINIAHFSMRPFSTIVIKMKKAE